MRYVKSDNFKMDKIMNNCKVKADYVKGRLRREERYPCLDGYRAIFCIAICFFYHYHWLMTDGYGMPFPLGDSVLIRWLYKYGYYGVEFFFVLSGFVTENKYINDGAGKLPNNISEFIWGKLKKYYPLLLTTLIVSTLLQFIFYNIEGRWFYVESVDALSFLMSVLNISSGWFFIDNNLNIPVWYISTLMLQWVAFYVLKKIDRGDGKRFRTGALLMVVLGLSILLGDNLCGPFLHSNSARGYYCFFLGCLLCDFYTKRKFDELFCQRTGYAMMSCVMVLFLAAILFGQESAWGNSQIIWGVVLCPSFIWCALAIESIKKFLEFSPLQFLAKLSPHIYFWHFTCYFLIRILSEMVPIRKYYSEI